MENSKVQWYQMKNPFMHRFFRTGAYLYFLTSDLVVFCTIEGNIIFGRENYHIGGNKKLNKLNFFNLIDFNFFFLSISSNFERIGE